MSDRSAHLHICSTVYNTQARACVVYNVGLHCKVGLFSPQLFLTESGCYRREDEYKKQLFQYST